MSEGEQIESHTQWESRVQLVRRHYEERGYRVHSGLQFGCELVLYADDPSRVHSDFCVHVVQEDGMLDWRMMQSLVRSMPDLHKTLIVASPILNPDGTLDQVQELAFATDHAPFRHRKARGEVGSQRKKSRKS
uniref:tRNA-intron lyase n=1 Tax=Entomoneis paludosa TaxID=265537 RepID=A0A7S2VF41_9STRA